jgi:hypothetical protein
MGKKSQLVFYVLILSMIVPILSFAQIPAQIIEGFKTGNAKIVASHFNENIELTILDRENVCSQAQGEQILKDFFLRNKPSDFQISHKGGESTVYAIGKLLTSNGNFRIYFLLKPNGSKPRIVQLRIEKD